MLDGKASGGDELVGGFVAGGEFAVAGGLFIFPRSGSSLPRTSTDRPSADPTCLTFTGPAASRTIAKIRW
jgi:hypothetical protein